MVYIINFQCCAANLILKEMFYAVRCLKSNDDMISRSSLRKLAPNLVEMVENYRLRLVVVFAGLSFQSGRAWI